MEALRNLRSDNQAELCGLAALEPFCTPVTPSDPFVACGAPMRAILDLVQRIAGTDSPVLVQGEPGVGKRAVAREIHRLSQRADVPLVHVACGVLRESELAEKLFAEPRESSLAGKTGASSLLECSRGGTLLVTDVCRLPLWAQVKLLDWLQQTRAQDQEHHEAKFAGARVIATTTCDLATAVAQNTFYAKLYYHLNIVEIRILPLRSRPEDIRALGEHFLVTANAMRHSAQDAAPRCFSEEAWEIVLSYDWPGNAPQLASVVARVVMLADGLEIGQQQVAACLGEVPQRRAGDTISIPLAGGLKQMELAIINEVLDRCRGNKAAAARSLRLHRRTLYRLLGQ